MSFLVDAAKFGFNSLKIANEHIPIYDKNRSGNLLDVSKLIPGIYIDASGNQRENVKFLATGYINIEALSNYYVSPLAIVLTCFYDSAFNVVIGGSNSSISSFTTPATAAYVRLSFDSSYKNVIQLKNGLAPNPNGKTPNLVGIPKTVKVSIDSIEGVSKSVNLFDKNKAVDGYQFSYAYPQPVTNAARGFSDFIPVIPGLTYSSLSIYSSVFNTTGTLSSILNGSISRVFYDASFNVIGGSDGILSQFTAPANAAYVIVTYEIGTWNGIAFGKDQFQVEINRFLSNYQPYYRAIEASNVLSALSPPSSSGLKDCLRQWNSYKRAKTGIFDIIFQGDSYTDGNYFAKSVRDNLIAAGFADGGPGYLSFANGDGVLASQSITPTQFYCGYTTGDYTFFSGTQNSTSWGVSGSHIVSSAASKVLTITSTIALATVEIQYLKTSGGAGFSYAINSGAATTISTANATDAVGYTTIDTSTAGSSFTITITSLGANVALAGAVGRKSGANLLTVHKAGLTGTSAWHFAGTQLFQSSAARLMQGKGLVVFCWGTNDIGNSSPSSMKAFITRTASYWRKINPTCDFLFVGAPETSRGTETLFNYSVSDYNDMMYQLAKEIPGSAYISFCRVFGPFSQTIVDSGLIHADRIHPGTAGAALISEIISGMLI